MAMVGISFATNGATVQIADSSTADLAPASPFTQGTLVGRAVRCPRRESGSAKENWQETSHPNKVPVDRARAAIQRSSSTSRGGFQCPEVNPVEKQTVLGRLERQRKGVGLPVVHYVRTPPLEEVPLTERPKTEMRVLNFRHRQATPEFSFTLRGIDARPGPRSTKLQQCQQRIHMQTHLTFVNILLR